MQADHGNKPEGKDLSVDIMAEHKQFFQNLDPICQEMVKCLKGIEKFQRRFFPPEISSLREEVLSLRTSIDKVWEPLHTLKPPEKFKEQIDTIISAYDLIAKALQMIISAHTDNFQQTVMRVMQAFRKSCQAQDLLFSNRQISPHINRFFLEPPFHDQPEKLYPKPTAHMKTGLYHMGTERDPYARGALSLYIPESYDGTRAWPVVVVLHGGFGHGRDFIWNWMREARSREFLLMSPSSKDTTWSILNPEIDGTSLVEMLSYVKRNWNVESDRILLTGISDGATFALMNSLWENSPFTAFALIASAFPPIDFSKAKGKRIYWIHGALDWMFPVQIAVSGYQVLKKEGVEAVLRVVEDLSHTYPRDENDRILTWFDPNLALPEMGSR